MEKTIIHLKGLNGIRAIAALAVVLSHIFLQFEQAGLKTGEAGRALGSYGVTMFFTLSGFLITWLLLQEKRSFNTVSIKEFYIRRILRIWPLYYFYILIIVIFLLVGAPGNLPGSLLYYILMGANIASIMGIAPALLEHYWSLGVEEQFYLFWPWLVKYFSPLKAVSFFLILFLIVKVALRIWMPGSFAYWFMFSTRFDCMAIGALCAILFDSKKIIFISFSFNKIIQLACWTILLLGAIGKFQILGAIDHDLFSAASAIVILNVAFNKKTMIGLENKLFDFLGRISYGIYVYHILVIYCLNRLLGSTLDSLEKFLQLFVLIVLAFSSTIFISWLSYNFLEKPFLRLKEKFSRIFSRT